MPPQNEKTKSRDIEIKSFARRGRFLIICGVIAFVLWVSGFVHNRSTPDILQFLEYYVMVLVFGVVLRGAMGSNKVDSIGVSMAPAISDFSITGFFGHFFAGALFFLPGLLISILAVMFVREWWGTPRSYDDGLGYSFLFICLLLGPPLVFKGIRIFLGKDTFKIF